MTVLTHGGDVVYDGGGAGASYEYPRAESRIPIDAVRRRAAGELKGVSGMNKAIWAFGGFKHEPPVSERHSHLNMINHRAQLQ